jgi:hypothetical protein
MAPNTSPVLRSDPGAAQGARRTSLEDDLAGEIGPVRIKFAICTSLGAIAAGDHGS